MTVPQYLCLLLKLPFFYKIPPCIFMLLHISGVEDFNWIPSFIAAIETEESVFSFTSAIMKQAKS